MFLNKPVNVTVAKQTITSSFFLKADDKLEDGYIAFLTCHIQCI